MQLLLQPMLQQQQITTATTTTATSTLAKNRAIRKLHCSIFYRNGDWVIAD